MDHLSSPEPEDSDDQPPQLSFNLIPNDELLSPSPSPDHETEADNGEPSEGSVDGNNDRSHSCDSSDSLSVYSDTDPKVEGTEEQRREVHDL